MTLPKTEVSARSVEDGLPLVCYCAPASLRKVADALDRMVDEPDAYVRYVKPNPIEIAEMAVRLRLAAFHNERASSQTTERK